MNSYKQIILLVLLICFCWRDTLSQQKTITILPFDENAFETNIFTQNQSTAKTDLIIFSYNRPLQLYALLESLEEYVIGLNKIMVLYRTDNQRYEQAYDQVAQRFNNVLFFKQSAHPHQDFKPLLMKLMHFTDSSYILFATDDSIVKDFIDINFCVHALKQLQVYNSNFNTQEQINAYGFYLRLGKNLNYCYPMQSQQAVPKLTFLGKDLYAWDTASCKDSHMFDWQYPNTVDMTIYPKESIIGLIQTIPFSNPNTFEGNWAQRSHIGSPKIGLCFEQSKVVNIPLNSVQDVVTNNRNMEQNPHMLLELFEQGLKIDRRQFYQWNNASAHAEALFEFIQR